MRLTLATRRLYKVVPVLVLLTLLLVVLPQVVLHLVLILLRIRLTQRAVRVRRLARILGRSAA